MLVAFGAGAQIHAHVNLLLQSYCTINRCIVVNRAKNDRLSKLKASLESAHRDVTFEFGVMSFGENPNDDKKLHYWVADADIVCTATSSTRVLFDGSWIKPRAHVNLVGSYTPKMHEVDEQLLRRAGKIVVDSREACLHEAGEIISAKLPPESLVEIGTAVNAEGDAICGIRDDVRRCGDVTIFKSVGVGIQDVVIAQAVLEEAQIRGIGVSIHDYDA